MEFLAATGDSAVTWVTAAAGALMVVMPVVKMVSGDRAAKRVLVVHGAMGAKGAVG